MDWAAYYAEYRDRIERFYYCRVDPKQTQFTYGTCYLAEISKELKDTLEPKPKIIEKENEYVLCLEYFIRPVNTVIEVSKNRIALKGEFESPVTIEFETMIYLPHMVEESCIGFHTQQTSEFILRKKKPGA